MPTDFLKVIKDSTGARREAMELLGCVFPHIFSKNFEEKQRLRINQVCGKWLARESTVKSWEDIDVCIDSMAPCHFPCSEALHLAAVLSNLDRGIPAIGVNLERAEVGSDVPTCNWRHWQCRAAGTLRDLKGCTYKSCLQNPWELFLLWL